MAKLMKIQAICAATESVQGVQAPQLATDYFYGWDISLKPNVEILEKDYTRNYLDTIPHAVGAVSYELSFKTELKGSGTAGTPYQPLVSLLEACGFSASKAAGSVTLTPVSSPVNANFYGAGKSATISVITDGLVNMLKGAVGNVKLTYDAHKIPVAEFTFKGNYVAMTDSASMPTQTVNETASYPVQLGTLTVSGSTAHVASKLEVDAGNEIAQIDDVQGTTGIKGFAVTGRKPKGSFDPLGVSVATHDFLGKVVAGSTFAGSFVCGATAGNIVTTTFNNMQYRDFSMVSKNELLGFQIPLSFSGTSAGNNWMTIAFS